MKYDKIECILVNKVYSSYRKKIKIKNIKLNLEKRAYKNIKFKNGFIKNKSLTIDYIKDRPGFKRVKFILKIPFEIFKEDGTSVIKCLPNILIDVVMFLPDEKDKLNYKIIVDTFSKMLDYNIYDDKILNFSTNVYLYIKTIKRVQLFIPAYKFKLEPKECEIFNPNKICDEFKKYPFPEFYPPQYKRKLNIRLNIQIKRIKDIIIFGQVKDCNQKGVEEALVRVFDCSNHKKWIPLGYTFSGYNGYYMLRLDSSYDEKNISIIVTK